MKRKTMAKHLLKSGLILTLLSLSTFLSLPSAIAGGCKGCGGSGGGGMPDMSRPSQSSYDMPVQSAQDVPSHGQVVQPMINARTAWEQQGTLDPTTYQNSLAERQDNAQKRYGGEEGIDRVALDAKNAKGGEVEAYALWNRGEKIDSIIVDGKWEIKDGKIYTAEGKPSNLQLTPNMFKGDRQVEVVFTNGVKTQAYTTPGTELMPFALPAGDSVQLSRSNGAGTSATETPGPIAPERSAAVILPSDASTPKTPSVSKPAADQPTVPPLQSRSYKPFSAYPGGFGGLLGPNSAAVKIGASPACGSGCTTCPVAGGKQPAWQTTRPYVPTQE